MKRVRVTEEEEIVRDQFEFLDVPCVHAGSLRRFQYMHLRDRCFEMHFERTRVLSEAKEMERFFRKASDRASLDEAARVRMREMISHYLVLEALGHPCALTHAALANKLHAIGDDKNLIATAREKWDISRRDLMSNLNARIAVLQKDIRNWSRSTWSLIAVGFKRHLYDAHYACDCFLCLDASETLREKEGGLCYLCDEAKPTKGETQRWLVSKMCDTCCARAQAGGLCEFCFGHIERGSNGAQCSGRGDFRRERARSVSLGESSALEDITYYPTC